MNKEVTKEFLEKMSQGVYLKELNQKTRPCNLEQIGKFTFRIILTQGLNRQIRRMCQEFGYKVTSLRRDRVVSVELKGLRSGQFRELQGEELAQLYKLCGMK